MAKYALLRERVALELDAVRLEEPPPASEGELALAHDPAYVHAVSAGQLSNAAMREIGFPWSAAMVERSRRSVGATIAAARAALREGVAINLAGGTHHAYRDRGSGFCVFNDVAVAARLMQAEATRSRRSLRVAIVDLDVHQGNGTASILRDDPSVFTLSMHGERNFPFRKEASDLDIGLPDGTRDDDYLDALTDALARMHERFVPELVLYIAGADVHENDRLGKLALTTQGVAQRDRTLFETYRRRGVPVAVAMGGGYGRDLSVTVEVQRNTVHEALTSWAAQRNTRATVVA